jgi:signal transduction histidine kinase
MSMGEGDVKTLQNYARELHKESQALSHMVTDFLNFARPVLTSINAVDLAQLLENTISDLRSLRPGKYEVRFQAAESAIAPCDATLMRQSFLNLLINAVEALGPAGAIDVSVVKENKLVRIAIEDNGHGITEDVLKKIFIPFFTTKTQGTGLGLSLVQKIVLAHNGRIEVRSTPGSGTRFLVTVPS